MTNRPTDFRDEEAEADEAPDERDRNDEARQLVVALIRFWRADGRWQRMLAETKWDRSPQAAEVMEGIGKECRESFLVAVSSMRDAIKAVRS